uniref:Endonuclease/exonuclease/phosphatase domain-containing protein n=1 Tax=Biomphalaria glabrata TaxID=6526 RepID=A0A2C9KHD4_BIOGL
MNNEESLDSCRLISRRLKASPFNITIIQAYAPTSTYDDEAVEEFYDHLQEVVNKVPKKDILVVQGDWNAKVGSDSYQTWKGTCGKYSNLSTNERGQRLLEFAKYNNLLLAITLGCHKKSRITTWHSPNGEHHNQIDYIMVQQRFKTSIHTAKTRSFPGADIGSDHLVHLKKVTKQGPTRIKFDLDKLKDPQVAAIFEAQVGGRFAALNILDSNDQDIDTQVNMLNTAVTDTALEILGKLRPLKNPG